MSKALLFVPFALVPVLALHCGGEETTQPTPTAPSASAPASTAPAASSAAAAEATPLQCPAPKPSKPVTPSTAPASCPDASTLDAVAKVDFAKAYKVDGKLAAQLKENAEMTAAMHDFTTRVDAAMQSGCAKILADLGCTADYGGMQGTCDAADDVLKQAKSRLGAAAQVSIQVDEPHCSVASQPALECLHQCAPSFKGKAAALKCDGASSAAGCEGVWSAPGVSDACATTCAMKLSAQATCTPSHVEAKIAGASDAKSAQLLQTVVDQDFHAVLLAEAARGRVAQMIKGTANVMKALGPVLEKAEPKNKTLSQCYDPVTTNETLAITDVALEQMVGLNVVLAPQKK